MPTSTLSHATICHFTEKVTLNITFRLARSDRTETQHYDSPAEAKMALVRQYRLAAGPKSKRSILSAINSLNRAWRHYRRKLQNSTAG